MNGIEIYIQKNRLLFLAIFKLGGRLTSVHTSFKSALPVDSPNDAIADMVIQAALFEEKDPVFLEEAAMIQRAIEVAEGREAATKASDMWSGAVAKLAGEKKWGAFFRKSELVNIYWVDNSISINFNKRGKVFHVPDSKKTIKIPIYQIEDLRSIDFRSYLQPYIDKFGGD